MNVINSWVLYNSYHITEPSWGTGLVPDSFGFQPNSHPQSSPQPLILGGVFTFPDPTTARIDPSLDNEISEEFDIRVSGEDFSL